MKRMIIASDENKIGSDGWDFKLESDRSLMTTEQKYAYDFLLGFSGVLRRCMHSIDSIQHFFDTNVGKTRRSDVYIVSGDAYYTEDKAKGDRVYAVAGIRQDFHPTRVYKFHDETSAHDKAMQLLKTTSHPMSY